MEAKKKNTPLNADLLIMLCQRLSDDCADNVAFAVQELHEACDLTQAQRNAITCSMTRLCCDIVMRTAELFTEAAKEGAQ